MTHHRTQAPTTQAHRFTRVHRFTRIDFTRIAAVGVVASLLAAFGAVFGSAPAQAADAYRYWIYWDAGATAPWIFATATADSMVPPDGTVDGWRFAIAGEPADTVRQPRIQPDFDAICGSTPTAPTGQKRVALVIDYGTTEDAPAGSTPPEPEVACVTVPADASSAQTLAATGKVRTEGGMICGIDGYPAAGCGDVVPNATIPPTSEPTVPVPVAASAPAAAAESGSSSTPWGLIVAVVIIAALAIAGVALSRRGRG